MKNIKKVSPVFSTQKGQTFVAEVGVVFGKYVLTKRLKPQCYVFKIWLGNMKESRMSKQIEQWWLPCKDKQTLEDCIQYLQPNIRVAIQGYRRTVNRYDKTLHRFMAIQICVAERIRVIGEYKEDTRNEWLKQRLDELKVMDELFNGDGGNEDDELLESIL